jgi:hypothetical protein
VTPSLAIGSLKSQLQNSPPQQNRPKSPIFLGRGVLQLVLNKRHFLMLELMIALFLVLTCALPLAQLPLKALKEETKSAYRIQIHRLADLAFAQFKEKLYRQEISWQELSSPSNDRAVFVTDTVTVGFEQLGAQKFHRKATFYSIGKKGQREEEWRLVTFKVNFKPQEKKYPLFRNKTGSKASSTLTYQVLVSHLGSAIPPATDKEPPQPTKP